MERHDPRLDDARLQDSEPLYIRLLGGFQVSVGDRAIEEDEWRLKKARTLLKLLALAPDHRLHREQVLGLLWPEFDPEAAANNLNYALHVARRVLEPDQAAAGSNYLRLEGEWLALRPEGPLWTDVEAFEGARGMARRNPEDLGAYRAALERYAGELLPEDRYEEWAEGRREELRGAYLSLLLELAKVSEARGETGAAIEALGRVVAEAPEHEEARAGLMRLYAASGQRHQALRHYEQLKEALWREYEAEPGAESRRLYEEILAGGVPAIRPSPTDHPPAEPPESRRHNLPAALSSFVGREREIDEIEGLLGTARLLTLTGAGGSGKTRLALAVAQDVVEEYPDGVWLVELASLSEEALVAQEVAEVLSVRERPDLPTIDTLVEALRPKRLLLVLDNCEHLVQAAAQLTRTLLASCEGLRVLATSREALDVPGETNRPVSPLSLPDPRCLATVEELEGYESVRLFVDRASSRRPAFTLTEGNAQAVGEICRRLDGIPLAIELAAARVGALSVEQISARLDDALSLLTEGSRTATPRQRTLRGALDWSYEMLSEEERTLFRRLSVFAGGWTLEAAETVGSGSGIEEGAVLDLVSRLVDKSLVVAGSGSEGAPRYGMLEPVRQYGRERLEESGEEEAVRRRHAAWCLAFAEEAEKGLNGPDQPRWLDWLETEHDNLRVALGYSLEKGKEETALRTVAALWLFWYTHGHLREGRGWLERTLSASPEAVGLASSRALYGAGYIALFQGEYAVAKELLEESLALYRRLESKEGIASCLHSLGFVALLGQRDLETVPALIEEATSLRPQLENKSTIANLLILEGLAAAGAGDLEKAAALHEEGLAFFREVGDARGTCMCLTNLGLIALARGELAGAEALLGENLRLARESDDKVCIHSSFFGLAGVAVSRDQPLRAARLWGAAEAVREAAGLHLTPLACSATNYDGLLSAARGALGEAAFDLAWAEGEDMTQEEAAGYVLESGEPSSPEQPPNVGLLNDLTRREREVASLLARGLTNRQIATELVVAKRTADTHVGNILRKLGLDSREQVAAWWAKQPPLPEDRD